MILTAFYLGKSPVGVLCFLRGQYVKRMTTEGPGLCCSLHLQSRVRTFSSRAASFWKMSFLDRSPIFPDNETLGQWWTCNVVLLFCAREFVMLRSVSPFNKIQQMVLICCVSVSELSVVFSVLDLFCCTCALGCHMAAFLTKPTRSTYYWYSEYSEMPTFYLQLTAVLCHNAFLYGCLLWARFSRG